MNFKQSIEEIYKNQEQEIKYFANFLIILSALFFLSEKIIALLGYKDIPFNDFYKTYDIALWHMGQVIAPLFLIIGFLLGCNKKILLFPLGLYSIQFKWFLSDFRTEDYHLLYYVIFSVLVIFTITFIITFFISKLIKSVIILKQKMSLLIDFIIYSKDEIEEDRKKSYITNYYKIFEKITKNL